MISSSKLQDFNPGDKYSECFECEGDEIVTEEDCIPLKRAIVPHVKLVNGFIKYECKNENCNSLGGYSIPKAKLAEQKFVNYLLKKTNISPKEYSYLQYYFKKRRYKHVELNKPELFLSDPPFVRLEYNNNKELWELSTHDTLEECLA